MAAPVAAAAAAPAAAATKPHKSRLWRYVFLSFLLFLGFKACRSCRDCLGDAERAAGVSAVTVSKRLGERGKPTIELDLGDAGTVTLKDLKELGRHLRALEVDQAGDAGTPSFERIAAEIGKAVDEAVREEEGDAPPAPPMPPERPPRPERPAKPRRADR